MPRDIRSLSADELQARFRDWSQPAYRATQVLEWLYRQRVTSWETMTNLPKALRELLRANFSLNAVELVSRQGARDTTQKFLWRLHDHALIESVLIPASPALYGEASDRHTLCVSTQVGCAYGCKFCASGLDGWKRNLGADEIVEQVLAVERWHAADAAGRTGQMRGPQVGGEKTTPLPGPLPSPASRGEGEGTPGTGRPAAPKAAHVEDSRAEELHAAPARLVNNLVIMGMGEPLANYDNLLAALRILNAPWGGGIGARKITVSTSGLAPQIRRLAEDPLQLRLAVSLHGATDETRNRIMPVNRKYPLAELTDACEFYQKRKDRMITLEYILIAGVNDSLDQIRPLARLAERLHAKVNLIPYNRVEELAWERPTEEAQEAFLAALENEKVTATLRREKGHDIDAACGQLRLKTERGFNLTRARPGGTVKA